MVLSTFFLDLSLKYSTLNIFVSVQLVAKVTAFPAMTASPATSMTSYTSTGYGPAAKVPGSPTGSLGGCTSPDRYIKQQPPNWGGWLVGIAPKALLKTPLSPSLFSTTVVLPNGFEASLYDEFLSSGSKRYQYIPQQVSQPQQFLPQHLQQQQQLQQQHRRGYGGLVIKREEDPYSRFVSHSVVK